MCKREGCWAKFGPWRWCCNANWISRYSPRRLGGVARRRYLHGTNAPCTSRSKGQELGTQLHGCSITHTEEALKTLLVLCSAWVPTGGICGSLFVYGAPSTRESCNYWPCNYTVRQVPHVDRANKIPGYFFPSARERVIMRSYGCELCSNYGFNNQATSNIITEWLSGTGDCYVLGLCESRTLETDLAAPSTIPTTSFSSFVHCSFEHLKGCLP